VNKQTNKQTNKQLHWWANADFPLFTVAVHTVQYSTGYLAQSFSINKVHPRTGYEGPEKGDGD
jgi:hypothetical protein